MLGKNAHVLVNNASTEIEEEDDEELCKWEHCANDLTELNVPLLTKSVSEDLDVSGAVSESQDNNGPVVDQVEFDMFETDEEIANTKRRNCSYQVRLFMNLTDSLVYFKKLKNH